MSSELFSYPPVAVRPGEVQTRAGWPWVSVQIALTRALGAAAVVEPDISLPRVPPAARVLLCTDGLTTALDEPSMAAVLGAEPDPDRAAAELVRLAADTGGTDDTTVVVVDLPVPA